MPTIYDVALRAGVSTYTVSAVLNRSARVSAELTQRVLQAASELDYTINRIASSLQTKRTRAVGMLIPDIANPWFAKVVRGVEDKLRANNYSLFLGNTYNRAEEQSRYLMEFRARRVDGVLLFLAPESEQDLAEMLAKKTPAVFLGRKPGKLEADSVTADNRLGTRLAVSHLIARGHKRVAILTGELSLSVSRERVAGWKQSLKKAGIEPRDEFVRECDWTADTARRHTFELLDLRYPPTAFFAANFLMMTGVLAALQERGLKVPSQAEVMSSDDSEWLDVFEPRISVILQPSHEMGARGAELLLERIADPDKAARQVVLRPSLKIR